MSEARIVRTRFTRDAILPPPPEQGGTVMRFGRRVLRRLGLISPAPTGTNLFHQNMGAYIFDFSDGQRCICPVAMELVEDLAADAEALARTMALKQVERRP